MAGTKTVERELLGGWVTTPEKATGWVPATIYPTNPQKRREILVPITSNPKDSIPLGFSEKVKAKA